MVSKTNAQIFKVVMNCDESLFRFIEEKSLETGISASSLLKISIINFLEFKKSNDPSLKHFEKNRKEKIEE